MITLCTRVTRITRKYARRCSVSCSQLINWHYKYLPRVSTLFSSSSSSSSPVAIVLCAFSVVHCKVSKQHKTSANKKPPEHRCTVPAHVHSSRWGWDSEGFHFGTLHVIRAARIHPATPACQRVVVWLYKYCMHGPHALCWNKQCHDDSNDEDFHTHTHARRAEIPSAWRLGRTSACAVQCRM